MRPQKQSVFANRPFEQAFGSSGPTPRRSEQQTIGDVWPHYLDDGYFTTEGNLRRDYVSRDKVEPLVRAMANANPPLVKHQLRRFFQHCRALESRLRSKQAEWRTLEADFCKLDAAAADAAGKTPAKIPGLFHDFIRRNVNAVRTEKDFLAGFLPHFEALVGFGALYLKDSERN